MSEKKEGKVTWPWDKKKVVYNFKEGDATDSFVLGIKGASLAEMQRLGINTPPGFILTSEACRDLLDKRCDEVATTEPVLVQEQPLREVFSKNVKALEKSTGKHFGGRYLAGIVSSFKPVPARDPGDDIAEFFGIKEPVERNTDPMPLLLAVRSSPTISAPGTMDTVLNVGLNDEIVRNMVENTANCAHWAVDTYRRFLQAYGEVVLKVPSADFDSVLVEACQRQSCEFDTQLTTESLREVVTQFKRIATVPEDPLEQLVNVTNAVALSWDSACCQDFRKMNLTTSDREGTAVVIQAMVYGNCSTCKSGVGRVSTRSPTTGEAFSIAAEGEFLCNAQGDDLERNIGDRVPGNIEKMRDLVPEACTALTDALSHLEKSFTDAQDVEFCVQQGKLFILQARCSMRTANATVNVACKLVRENIITEKAGLLRLLPKDVSTFVSAPMLQLPTDKEREGMKMLYDGAISEQGQVRSLSSANAVVGKLVFSSTEAAACKKRGQPCILCAERLSANNMRGIEAAQAVILLGGSTTCHMVALLRSMSKPVLYARGALHTVEQPVRPISATDVESKASTAPTATADIAKVWVLKPTMMSGAAAAAASAGEAAAKKKKAAPPRVYHEAMEGDTLTVDGASGCIFFGSDFTFARHGRTAELDTMVHWAEDFKRMHVMSFADDCEQSTIHKACADGAEGLDHFSTHGIFLKDEHTLDQLRLYLLTESGEERVECLENMRESHKQAFLAMMRTASSRPVGVTLLHHDMCAFFPCQYSAEFKTVAAKLAGKLGIDADACAARIKRMLDPLPPAMARAQPQDTAPSEFMPPQLRVNMLSAARRPFTDLAYMQSGALVEAGITVAREGFDVHPHVHIPHACSEFDVERVAAVVKSAHTDVTKRDKFDIRFMIGVVIDTPRALWSAGAFSSLKHVDGIIFSTDELSEMFTGMTRHDSATFMNRYTANRDVDYDPYESIDLAVLGEAIMDAAQQCKLANPSLNIAARGKLCGDKDTVAFFEQCGLNCISCPRSKIAVAKLAAAHARIEMQAMEAIRSKNMAKPFAGIAEQHPKPRLSSRAGPTIAKAKSLSVSSSTGAQKDFGETMKDLFAIKPRGGEVGTP